MMLVGIVECPEPSCTPASLTDRCAMSDPELWPGEAERFSSRQPWIVTWAALELAVALATSSAANREGLLAAGALPLLCFLRHSPDTLEGDFARDLFQILVAHLGVIGKSACVDAERS